VSTPLVVTVAPTGADTGRDRTPHVPQTAAEIATEAAASAAAGASVIHVHVRDGAGAASMDLGLYREAMAAIREAAPRLLINLTTAGSWEMEEHRRLAVVALAPDICSFDAGSLNFGDGVFLNPPPFLRALAEACLEHGVKPELECFDVSHVEYCGRLAGEGLLAAPLWFQFVMGIPGGIAATPRNLMHLAGSLPDQASWSVIGVGRNQQPMTTLAIAAGGHVRVGMEDNIHLSRGVLATSNAEFVERVAALGRLAGRPPAGREQARRLIGLAAEPESVPVPG
jgi:3-keto-5-aminohexanoate cleavage enzyme